MLLGRETYEHRIGNQENPPRKGTDAGAARGMSEAEYYAKTQDNEKTLSNLSEACARAVAFIEYIGSEKYTYTSLLYKGLEESPSKAVSMNYSDNNASGLLSRMKNTAFDFIRSEPEFKQIEAKLSEYAGKWTVKEPDNQA